MSSPVADVVFVYVTHPDLQAATSLGRALVEAGLAACVNLMAGMQTIYRWEGRIETGHEAVMIVKTRADLFEEVRRSVIASHPYVCPCVVAFPISAGHPDYLDWVRQSCSPDGRS